MNINHIELELHKRLIYPYVWHSKQNNTDDALTAFVYTSDDFDYILDHINTTLSGHPNFEDIRDYALNRWFNYWSSQAIEYLFNLSKRVVYEPNKFHHTTDFTIDGIPFDHKTSVFPRGYPQTFGHAQENPEDLIQWLYLNQSQQQRMHVKNRLFLILYRSDGQHWKLKAEIAWLQEIIAGYLETFSKSSLYEFEFETKSITLSDIIWGIT